MHLVRQNLLALTALLIASSGVSADVRLPRLFSDHMVLQRDRPLNVWGWAEPGENVTVTLACENAEATADAEGQWRVSLGAMQAGGPYAMVVQGKNQLTLRDVLIGEVWVASGQSNMEMPLGTKVWPNAYKGVRDFREEIAAAKHPQIRLFLVPNRPAWQPQADLDDTWWEEFSGKPTADMNSRWRVCEPETAERISATGYFFVRELHRKLQVPIGLVDASWGATRIEPWIARQGLASTEGFAAAVDAFDQTYARRFQPFVDSNSTEKAPAPGYNETTALYNGMIHPLVRYSIRGAIWYQGEANLNDGMRYRAKMQALIRGWRNAWGQDDFPFYFAQLAPYRYGGDPSQLARLWEAQTATLSEPNTGMAVTIDIATLHDIHPPNKQEVGRRLALWALANTYAQKGLVYSGPIYSRHLIEGDTIRVHFRHTGGGLTARDDKPLAEFTIAGKDQKFAAATATIDGETVVVRGDTVPEPVAVRFAFHQEAKPNLINKEGLPASSFRTDAW